MEFNFDSALFLFFARQRLDNPGMRLEPEQVASISVVYKGKDVFITYGYIYQPDLVSWCVTKRHRSSQKRYRSSWIVSFEELAAN